MRVTQAMDRVPLSTRAQSRGSREHSSEILCVVRPIKYESYTAMNKVYLHVYKATAHFFVCLHVFTYARSSPKRHLTGLILQC